MSDIAHIYVGSDRSQLLAVSVLAHSIRRHTEMEVAVRSMHDLDLPQPRDPRHWPRTNFSFTRFAVPQLNGYRGRAAYMDADMLVFHDIGELWQLPFQDAKVIIQEDPKGDALAAGGARAKQCSVMVIDCAACPWQPEAIIAGLDGAYTYRQLMGDLCILRESEISYGLPYAWNSLEHYEPGVTRLIHYTDMPTQPWVAPENKWGWLWLNEVRLMLETGQLQWRQIEEEVRLGYFRPSLLAELKLPPDAGAPDPDRIGRLLAFDRQAGFVKHREVMDRVRTINRTIADYEKRLQMPDAGR